jgi:hypothetical protein
LTFLIPAAMALAGLALVPLVLHLVRRETDRRVPFPSLRYLRSAQRQSARSMRIRDRLLVLARMAVIILLAAAASSPLIGTGEADSHPPTDLVLLVDNTASMDRLAGGRTLLESARQSVEVSLAHASAGDRVWLLSAVDGPLVAGGTPAEAARLLPAIRPSDAGASLPLAARMAASAIPGREDRVRELQIFSDLQAGSFAGDAEIADDWAVRVLRVSPQEDGNGRVASLAIGPAHPIPPGSSLSVTARLEAGSGSDLADADSIGTNGDQGTQARLMVDGRTAAIRAASWGSDVAFSIPAPEPGAHVVRVEIDPEGLRSDDGRQAGIRVAESAGVQLVGDSSPDAEFIASAIETLAADNRVRRPAGPVDVAIQVGGARYANPVTSGATTARILIPPSDQLALAAFNRELVRLGIPWTAEPDPAAGTLRILDIGVPAISGESVSWRYRLRSGAAPPSPEDSVLLRTSDGEAWLVRGRTSESGVYLLVASPLVPAATGLPAGVGMIEFVDALVNRWARPGDPPVSIEAGTEMALPSRADSLVAPDGPPVRVEGGAPWRPRTVGAWRLVVRTDAGREARYIGVNVPAGESDPSIMDGEGLTAAFGPASDVRVSSPDEWSEQIFAKRRGRNIAGVLLATTLVMLAFETWLSGARRARTSDMNGKEPTGAAS